MQVSLHIPSWTLQLSVAFALLASALWRIAAVATDVAEAVLSRPFTVKEFHGKRKYATAFLAWPREMFGGHRIHTIKPQARSPQVDAFTPS